MEARTLLCFGGPLNERLTTIDRVPVLACVHDDTRTLAWYTPSPERLGLSFRTVQYDLERFAVYLRGWSDEVGFRLPDNVWVGECLVAQGYPKHRISDALNAILGIMCAWGTL